MSCVRFPLREILCIYRLLEHVLKMYLARDSAESLKQFLIPTEPGRAGGGRGLELDVNFMKNK